MKLPYSEDELFRYVYAASKEFYELVYEDPWFSKIFRNIEQEVITNQQADFMVQNMGGPKRFGGRAPKDAHPHIWVDEDIWQYREDLLKLAFKNLNTPKDIAELWLRIDQAFKAAIINLKGPSECEKRYTTDEIIYEPMPDSIKKKVS